MHQARRQGRSAALQGLHEVEQGELGLGVLTGLGAPKLRKEGGRLELQGRRRAASDWHPGKANPRKRHRLKLGLVDLEGKPKLTMIP